MRKLLVTGGAGFIGANFVHYWCEKYPDDRVVVLDALTYAGNRVSLAPLDGRESFRFVQGDIGDRA
ncbi:MAG: GDP-mannose 4,6-dehydratase, partial [Woeseiaceae bacterium]|nr:GDP-mannose 4,6-dehydratase [Woeseiaceae bacterium]